MNIKPLLYSLIGLVIGILVTTLTITSFNKQDKYVSTSNNGEMTMSQMVVSLKDKKGG